ncbi:hypothetical protein AGLY_002742 [Aphis glycines]|uniref:Uncharacterized protein n=1 Tax=Aphis glycines TaxID=307491 RepID=A0A6G0U142_APHGL|nr:hypothetical protein AGLY_002742 [Aphis glycines]
MTYMPIFDSLHLLPNLSKRTWAFPRRGSNLAMSMSQDTTILNFNENQIQCKYHVDLASNIKFFVLITYLKSVLWILPSSVLQLRTLHSFSIVNYLVDNFDISKQYSKVHFMIWKFQNMFNVYKFKVKIIHKIICIAIERAVRISFDKLTEVNNIITDFNMHFRVMYVISLFILSNPNDVTSELFLDVSVSMSRTHMQYNNTFYRPMGIKENSNKNTITDGRVLFKASNSYAVGSLSVNVFTWSIKANKSLIKANIGWSSIIKRESVTSLLCSIICSASSND